MYRSLGWKPVSGAGLNGAVYGVNQAQRNFSNSLDGIGDTFNEIVERNRIRNSNEAALAIMKGTPLDEAVTGGNINLDPIRKAVEYRNAQNQLALEQEKNRVTGDAVASIMGRPELVGQNYDVKTVSDVVNDTNEFGRKSRKTDAEISNINIDNTRADRWTTASIKNMEEDNRRLAAKDAEAIAKSVEDAKKGGQLTPYQTATMVGKTHDQVLEWIDDNPGEAGINFIMKLPREQRDNYLKSLDPEQRRALVEHGEVTEPGTFYGTNVVAPAGKDKEGDKWLKAWEKRNLGDTNIGSGSGNGSGNGSAKKQSSKASPDQSMRPPAEDEVPSFDEAVQEEGAFIPKQFNASPEFYGELEALFPDAMEMAGRYIAELRRRGIEDEAQLLQGLAMIKSQQAIG